MTGARPLSILLLDDNPDDRMLTLRALKRSLPGLEVIEITNAQEFAQALEAEPADLVVTDYQLCWTDGLTVVRTVKAHWPGCPVVMFTGTGSEEIAVEAMKAGLDDYVLKSPHHYTLLPVAVQAAFNRAAERRRALDLHVRYRQLIDNLPVGVYRSSVGGEFLELNPAGLRLLGFDSLQEAASCPISSLYADPGDRERLLQELERRGHVSGWRIKMRRPDGGTFWAELHSIVVRDQGGKFCFVDGILEDATHQVEANTLREAALALTTTLDRNQVIERILAQLQKVVPYDSASVQLLRQNNMEIVGGRGFPNLDELLGSSFPVDGATPNAEVFSRRRPFIVADAPIKYEPFRQQPHAALGTRSWLGVPMLVGERFVGMIALDKREPEFYTAEHARLAEAFAAQAAIAIENSRLFEEARRRAKELNQMHQAAVAISSCLELGEVLRTLARQVGRMLDVSSAYICDWDRETAQTTVLAEWIGPRATGLERESDLGMTYDLSQFPTTLRALEEKQPLFVRSSDPTLDPPEQVGAEQYGWKSFLIVPLVSQDRVIGYIELWETEWEREFTEVEIQLCQTLAADAAAAIERARLFDEAVRRTRELSILLEASGAISSTLDLDWVLQALGDRLLRMTGANACIISEWERESDQVAVIWQVGEMNAHSLVGAVYRAAERPEVLEVLLTQQPLLLRADDANDGVGAELQGRGLDALLLLSMVARGRTVGLIELARREGTFTADQIRLAQALANQAAVAMVNVRLYEEIRCFSEELEERVQERTAQIQAQYARLETVLRSTSDGIIVTNGEGNILQTNPIAHTWLTQILSDKDAQQLRDAVYSLVQRVEERPEMVLELKGLDLQLNAAPISEPGMEGARAVVAVHDVSHLKALDRLKSRLVSNVSHELRTPITTIRLYVSLLRQCAPEDQAEYLDALEQEAERQARLIEDILQISRVDAGRLELHLRPIPLIELAETVVDSHRVLAQERGLTLELGIVTPGLVVLVDRGQMMQALNNLVINAIRYTPAGGRVVVATEKEEVNGRRWAQVKVTDTGIGIPEAELPYVFDRFFRGEEPRQMQVPGTGLGLAIVQEVLELHGGQVTVQSEVGQGSEFIVWLPLGDGEGKSSRGE
ncbi:MAG: GAF domain-containing protein [Anaerolineae bacterium]|nr:GAF domain-containing protein [Anaerolineae bacterium]